MQNRRTDEGERCLPWAAHDGYSTDLDEFEKQGFIVFPTLLNDHASEALRREINLFVEARMDLAVLLPNHADLVTHPRLLAIAASLMRGRNFGFHHLHSARHDVGTEALCWHHDYEQAPQSSRTHTMLHFFIYPTGLDGTVGDLLLLPGSHRTVLARNSMSHLGSAILTNTVVIDNLPPGSVVAVHSALHHARRAKPGGEGAPRYFVDISYCQEGRLWPAYVERGDWRQILALLRARDLARGGHLQWLFREDYFNAHN